VWNHHGGSSSVTSVLNSLFDDKKRHRANGGVHPTFHTGRQQPTELKKATDTSSPDSSKHGTSSTKHHEEAHDRAAGSTYTSSEDITIGHQQVAAKSSPRERVTRNSIGSWS